MSGWTPPRSSPLWGDKQGPDELPWWKLLAIEAIRFIATLAVLGAWAFVMYLAHVSYTV